LSFIDRAPYYYLHDGSLGGFLLEWQNEVLERAEVANKLRQTMAKGILNWIQKYTNPFCLIGWYKNSERQKYGNFTNAIYQNKPLVVLTRSNDGRFDYMLIAPEEINPLLFNGGFEKPEL
jgi:polar amino acid transport system substrate-binding protein